jgi:hypothetical protein
MNQKKCRHNAETNAVWIGVLTLLENVDVAVSVAENPNDNDDDDGYALADATKSKTLRDRHPRYHHCRFRNDDDDSSWAVRQKMKKKNVP